MKTLFFSAFILLFSLSFQSASAQNALTKETIKVWGNCGMCEKKIEAAALTAGAGSADWSSKKKQLKVSYDPAKTNSATIQQAIAATGYDTQDFTASQSAYDNLHDCCKYDRKNAVSAKAASCCHAGQPCADKEHCAGKSCCTEGKACKDKDCCKDGVCQHKSMKDAAPACCTEGKACSNHGACKEKGCCKSSDCCKS